MRRTRIKTISYLLAIFLLLLLSGCSGKTPIQKYKEAIDKKDIKIQVKEIETLKESIAQVSDDENYLTQTQQIIADMEKKNNVLIESLDKIRIKDSSIIELHDYMVKYCQNNAEVILKTTELIVLYQGLLETKDQKVIEETYGNIVQLARSIDTLSQQTNNYRIAWEEDLITMDIKAVQ